MKPMLIKTFILLYAILCIHAPLISRETCVVTGKMAAAAAPQLNLVLEEDTDQLVEPSPFLILTTI